MESISGKRVVLTGNFAYYPSKMGGRKALAKLINKFGGSVDDKVSYNTSYLVAGENGGNYTVGTSGRKSADAESMGVTELGEIEFLNKFFPDQLHAYDRRAPQPKPIFVKEATKKEILEHSLKSPALPSGQMKGINL